MRTEYYLWFPVIFRLEMSLEETYADNLEEISPLFLLPKLKSSAATLLENTESDLVVSKEESKRFSLSKIVTSILEALARSAACDYYLLGFMLDHHPKNDNATEERPV